MNTYVLLSRFFQYRSGKNLGLLLQRLKSTKSTATDGLMNVLNVAEKNDVAKNVANILGRGGVQRREGRSKFNKIYTFQAEVTPLNRNCNMIMTSVSGHLLNYEFPQNYAKWYAVDPVQLFDAPISPNCTPNCENIKKTIEMEARKCDALIIWTDCDREGENIGFEIINVARAVRPNIRVLRAHFSEITAPAIYRALNGLTEPDKKISDAVDVRQQLDLRIGAAFTRFLTMGLQAQCREVSADGRSREVISYGSCQFPTLGFVVERWKERENFVSQPFYYLEVSHKRDEMPAVFNWVRSRLFCQRACLAVFEKVQENTEAEVTNVTNRPKSKYRPLPMDTVSLERLASSKLKINAKKALEIAEKLYTSGFISYPRTETNKFPPELKLNELVQAQVPNQVWGRFASRIIDNGGPTPRNGTKSDQAHPPIHPTKLATNLKGDEAKIYELVVRHFLACCDKDAVGSEVEVVIEIQEERFSLKGLRVDQKNYLEVYIYEKWTNKEIPRYNLNERFQPTSVNMKTGATTAPDLLTESQLIALMDKHGIGTDATHAEHIETIKNRKYILQTPDRKLQPLGLGIGLVEGYETLGYALNKPHLRANLERELKDICDGKKTPDAVLQNQIREYRRVFEDSSRKKEQLFNIVRQHGAVRAGA